MKRILRHTFLIQGVLLVMFWAFLSGLAVVRVMFNPEVLQIVIAVAFLAVTAVLVWLWEKARKNKPEEVKGHGA